MPVLDEPMLEAFVHALVRNGNKQMQAYREANPGTKASDKTCTEKASRLWAQGKVKARFAELHAQVAEQATTLTGLTLEAHMQKLEELRDLAQERGQLNAAIAAEVKRGELRRLYVKQVETGKAGDFERMSDEELREHIANEAKELGVAGKAIGTRH